jgi:hypothetical protein
LREQDSGAKQMGDSQLLQNLTRLDPDVARKYYDITRDDPAAVIGKDDIVNLFEVAASHDNKIGDRDVQALIQIISTARFSDDGKTALLLLLANAQVMEALGRGVGVPVDTDEKRRILYDALALGARAVNFKSPETHVEYNAAEYGAMRDLIKSGDIISIAVCDHGMVYGSPGTRPANTSTEGYVASYDPNTDPPTLYLFQGMPATGALSWMVHEFSHAIQDWNDDKSARKFREADAYIAQGLSNAVETGRPVPNSHPAKRCVDIVLSGSATSRNPGWAEAYRTFADVVAQTPANSLPTPSNPKGTERAKKLAGLLKAAQNIKSAGNGSGAAAGRGSGSGGS